MVRAEPIDSPARWRTKLSKPVRLIQRVAFTALIVAVLLLVAGVAWLVHGIMSGGLQLALWQQALVVLGLVLLVMLAGLAFRIAFFARVVRGFLR